MGCGLCRDQGGEHAAWGHVGVPRVMWGVAGGGGRSEEWSGVRAWPVARVWGAGMARCGLGP